MRVLAVEAPVQALLEGPGDLGVALAMCVALALAAGALGWKLQSAFTHAAVVVTNYAVSLAAVSMDPDGAGRVALTGLWAVGGSMALMAGRAWDRRDLRRGGGALLAAAVTKAAFVDTVLLDGTHRAVALLLCGAVVVATAIAEARWAAAKPSGAPAAQ